MIKQTKLCKACDKVLSTDDFSKNKASWDGFEYRCKVCVKLKKMIPRVKRERGVLPFGQHDFYSLSGVDKNEYKEMYKLLAAMGYDITKNIHEQFIERGKERYNVILKPKKRLGNAITRFLFDGTENPEYLKFRKKG